jgi:nicotinamidase-related amidase
MDDNATSVAKTPPHDSGRGGVALLIIDMINAFDFEGGDVLAPKAFAAADTILSLRDQVGVAGGAVIYVNDNFGEWHSEKSRLVERAIDAGSVVTATLAPRHNDYFIMKPQFSGFYSTNLQVLLPKLGVSRLILTGVATDICILFTAADAHMRDYSLWVPQDAVASEDDALGQSALAIMQNTMGAETATTRALDLTAWNARLDRQREG